VLASEVYRRILTTPALQAEFVDDATTTGEHSSGSVSQIRLFDQALTANEVALLACTELAIADPTFPCLALQQ